MNPFEINTMPVDSLSGLFYRDKEIEQIRNCVEKRKQTVILGPEGVGKTSLLNSVFDRNYRIQKAKERILISPVTEFPTDLKDEEIYNHFTEMIVNSVRILSQCGQKDKMDEILQECRALREEGLHAKIYFENIVNLICRNREYRIVMVVDNFEQFTSSKDVTMKHHEMLRKLLYCLQFIVATNYDLSEDSLAPGASGSFLLMCFAGNELRIGGWSKEQTQDFICEKLKSANVSFSTSLIDTIYEITGGIPTLLNVAANFAYDYITKNKSENGLKLIAPLYQKEMVRTLFFHWCKMIQPMQLTALQHLLQNTYDNENDQKKLRALYHRGLLNYKVLTDPFGNSTICDNEYQFCGDLFAYFCQEEGNLELAASKNPLAKLQKTSPSPSIEYTTEDLSSLIQTVLDYANSKLRILETSIHEAEVKIDADIDEYRDLGTQISQDSERLKRLEMQYNKITDLKIVIDSKFDLIMNQIRSATSAEQLYIIRTTTENMYAELEGQLKVIVKGGI